MPQNKVYKFRDINDVQGFLNGELKSALELRTLLANSRAKQLTVPGLVGKKLKFSQPSAFEVTFSAGTQEIDDPTSLTLKDIATQIATASGSTVLARASGGYFSLIEVTPTNGIHIIPATVSNLDARALLGFSPNQDSISKVYPPVQTQATATAPCWIWSDTTGDNYHVVYTWE